MDAVTSLLRLTQSSAFFQSRQEMTPRARERRPFIKTLRDVSLHPKISRFDEALQQFNSDDEHPCHNEIATNNDDINETAFFNDGDEVEMSPVLRASHSYVQ